MIVSLLKSFFIGALSYLMMGSWINWGDLPPTMKTPGVAYGLNAVMLIFWITSFVIYEKLRRDYE
ncbi:hypothetical protein LQZ13_03850 [Leuconostoc mesenteroides]|uniref:hypothetical protein n=1 Tax=Leuconostoc mesenteroides TaxID=1245 RepID=UPI002114D7CA|nr:hypothetical protein [Leuconostoc mesenteroides]UUE18571.1 hypothetical protein LQZ13_03850 [Leuconostoc mesenteroides]